MYYWHGYLYVYIIESVSTYVFCSLNQYAPTLLSHGTDQPALDALDYYLYIIVHCINVYYVSIFRVGTDFMCIAKYR